MSYGPGGGLDPDRWAKLSLRARRNPWSSYCKYETYHIAIGLAIAH
jgi:hypothetical protein